MTGVALASAAAVVAAVPAIVPSHDVAVASSPAPLALSTAKYELTSITEITVQGINDAYWFGWGGFLGPDTPYYQAENNIYLQGIPGVLYYLTDCATSDNCSDPEQPSNGLTLDNYFFEAGGVPAVIDVVVNEVFGEGSVPGLLADSIFKYGTTNVINSLIYSAAEGLPEFNLGPVKLGGGILAGLYFYGETPDGSYVNPFVDGNGNPIPGLSAILGYISVSISDALPTAAATSAAAKTAEATTLAATETATTGDTKSSETTTEAETATEAAPKATGGFKKEAEEATTETAVTAAAATEDTSTEATTSTDTTDATDSTLPKATPTVKAPKTAKSENPLAKIGQKISDAISGKKESKSDSGSSSDSGSGGSGSAGGSAKS